MSRLVDRRLSDRLDQLRADGDRCLSAGELADVIDEVAQTLVVGVPAPRRHDDGTEVPLAGADPAAALAALAGIVVCGNKAGQLAELERELDEVRAATQEAAATFLSVAEAIEDIAGHPDVDPGDQADLYRCATTVYETSAFQDLTGQRLSRAADMLRRLECSVVSAQAALGDHDAAMTVRDLTDALDRAEAHKMERILHGPQKAGTANTQEEIDKILASID